MTANFTCRFDDNLYDQLNELSELKVLPLAHVVRDACREYIKTQSTPSTTWGDPYKEALIWVDATLRHDWYAGLHPDGLQDIVNGLQPLMRRLRFRPENVLPMCRAQWDLDDIQCYLEVNHPGKHQSISKGTMYYYGDNSCEFDHPHPQHPCGKIA